MARIIALDIGGKRTGIAETDPLKIIASPKETVATDQLELYLKSYFAKNEVETIVIGQPLSLDGGDSDNSQRVREWTKKIEILFPKIPIVMVDERFSSKMASQVLVQSGMKKKKRQQKGSLDPVSASIILQDYLDGLN